MSHIVTNKGGIVKRALFIDHKWRVLVQVVETEFPKPFTCCIAVVHIAELILRANKKLAHARRNTPTAGWRIRRFAQFLLINTFQDPQDLNIEGEKRVETEMDGDKRCFYSALCTGVLRMSVNNFKAIFTLLVFLIAGVYLLSTETFPEAWPHLEILVSFPVYIPIPQRVLGFFGLFKTRRKNAGAEVASGENATAIRIPLNYVTAPVAAVFILLAAGCIHGEQLRNGIIGSDGVEPLNVMALFTCLVSSQWKGSHLWWEYWCINWGIHGLIRR
jgi:hypothetical protein